jgi:hypothetical protein
LPPDVLIFRYRYLFVKPGSRLRESLFLRMGLLVLTRLLLLLWRLLLWLLKLLLLLLFFSELV